MPLLLLLLCTTHPDPVRQLLRRQPAPPSSARRQPIATAARIAAAAGREHGRPTARKQDGGGDGAEDKKKNRTSTAKRCRCPPSPVRGMRPWPEREASRTTDGRGGGGVEARITKPDRITTGPRLTGCAAGEVQQPDKQARGVLLPQPGAPVMQAVPLPPCIKEMKGGWVSLARAVSSSTALSLPSLRLFLGLSNLIPRHASPRLNVRRPEEEEEASSTPNSSLVSRLPAKPGSVPDRNQGAVCRIQIRQRSRITKPSR
ncbi:hypothetical protein CDD83_7709 [Cordyceps sp. RAO-2017]|nr:hypothetical protein CDD83_7709 [Cordyceps sp. RAO-2017]